MNFWEIRVNEGLVNLVYFDVLVVFLYCLLKGRVRFLDSTENWCRKW